MLPVELDQATAKVAEAVESERQADRPLLCDMVRREINKISEKQDKEIESLKAQLKQLKAKLSKKGNNNNTSKNFWNGGGLAQKNRAKTQSRAGTDGYKAASRKRLWKTAQRGIQKQARWEEGLFQERQA